MHYKESTSRHNLCVNTKMNMYPYHPLTKI